VTGFTQTPWAHPQWSTPALAVLRMLHRYPGLRLPWVTRMPMVALPAEEAETLRAAASGTR